MATSASCPGKLMIAGEYAVIEGGPALMFAINRRAVAHLEKDPQPLSPFLEAVHKQLIADRGQDCLAAKTLPHVRVDTDGFRDEAGKLGLGSSAAATVAATALALGQEALPPERFVDEVFRTAFAAHGDAQEAMGARGSGADVAASSYGGLLRVQAERATRALHHRPLPMPPVHWVFPYTGSGASTAALVAKVHNFRDRDTRAYQARIDEIISAANALDSAKTPAAWISGVERAGVATRELGEAAGVSLWLPVHEELAQCARGLGGALKSTGAGGGDLAAAAFVEPEAAHSFRDALQARGILCPDLGVDSRGVCLDL